ncbi:MAG: lipocalin family protein, partial [Candidatus Cloacimonetes bacterium]|nr:lipocalin family protein [Candidatus Cloacimonadota bacterium]
MLFKMIALVFMLISVTMLSAAKTVDQVDLNRYLGRWYQYAYFPTKFQPKDAALSAADYSLDKKGKIIVINTSYKDKAGTQILKQVSG